MNTLPIFYQSYLSKYDTPHNDFHVNLVRIFVGLFFAWKVLSRDFGFMGILPPDFFYFYPIQTYRPSDIILTTGVPVLMEIVTLHWIHWFTGMPSESVLTWLGYALATLGVSLAVFGRGPYRVLAAATYLLATYLWGFMFLSGQEVDSVFLYFGMLLIVTVASYSDAPIWRLPALFRAPANVEAGRAFSAVLLVFVIYYGLSGYNKIADISIAEWFRYDLVGAATLTYHMQILGNYYGSPFPSLFHQLNGMNFFNHIAAPLVYLSHITVPVVFFYRRHILKYAVFYTAFHFLTMSVAIAFTGYVIAWWILLDWRRILARLTGRLEHVAS